MVEESWLRQLVSEKVGIDFDEVSGNRDFAIVVTEQECQGAEHVGRFTDGGSKQQNGTGRFHPHHIAEFRPDDADQPFGAGVDPDLIRRGNAAPVRRRGP